MATCLESNIRSESKYKKVWSVTGGSGQRAGRLEGLQLDHDANCGRLVAAGMVKTFSASLAVHSHVAYPCTEEGQVAVFVTAGNTTTLTMWRTVSAAPFNSQFVFKAQAVLHTAEEAAAAEKEGASARDKAEASAAAVAARTKRGAAGDGKLELRDSKAVVKSTHIARGKTGFSKFNAKVLCLNFLASVSPAHGKHFCLLSLNQKRPHPRPCHRTRTHHYSHRTL